MLSPLSGSCYARTMRLEFDVFGRRILVEATADGWAGFIPGRDGKRRPADFAIPSDLEAPELASYLDDLFHEHATADHPAVRILSRGD